MTRTYTPPSNGGLRTPAEMLRSEIRAVRETGKRHIRRRLGLGWSAEDAANVAIGAMGRPAKARPQLRMALDVSAERRTQSALDLATEEP